MLVIVGEIDDQKKVIPLTADTGSGNPVGSYLYLEKKSNPAGYLYCDGSTFDETVYPALYAYLGTNVLPDWRELGAKGVGKNTTLIFDSTETDPSTGQAGTQNHDVYAEGEFKDDQVQNHRHKWQTGSASIDDGVEQFTVKKSAGWNNYTQIANGTGDTGSSVRIGGVMSGRFGDVTRGKSRGVYIYIKATSGLSENAQDNVLSTLNQQRSYSETETDTGKKWIDGKPIYRKVIDFGALPNNTTKSVNHNITYDTVTKLYGFGKLSNGLTITLPRSNPNANTNVDLYISSTQVSVTSGNDISGYYAYVILEYTKSS